MDIQTTIGKLDEMKLNDIYNFIHSSYKIVKVRQCEIKNTNVEEYFVEKYFIGINENYLDIYEVKYLVDLNQYSKYDLESFIIDRFSNENMDKIIIFHKLHHEFNVNIDENESVCLLESYKDVYVYYHCDFTAGKEDHTKNVPFVLLFEKTPLFFIYREEKLIQINGYHIFDLFNGNINNTQILYLLSGKYNSTKHIMDLYDEIDGKTGNTNLLNKLDSYFIYELGSECTYRIRLTNRNIKSLRIATNQIFSFCDEFYMAIYLYNAYETSKDTLSHLLPFIIGNRRMQNKNLPWELIEYIYNEYFEELNFFK